MKKYVLLIILFISSICLCSCHDSVEVDDMIYVLAIGVDESDNGNFRYTFQSAVPLNISSGVETSFSSSEKSTSLQNISVSAPNLYYAIDIANQKVTKEINISHCKLLLFSSSLAESSLEHHLKSVIPNPQIRPATLVAVSEKTAEEYLNNISSPFELNPARYYDMFFGKDYSPQSFTAHLYDFEKSETVAVPLIGDDNKISTCVINNFTQSGILNNDETIALNMITGKFGSGYVTIDRQLPAININQDKSPRVTIKPDITPEITVNLSFYGTPTTTIEDKSIDIKVKKYIEILCKKLLAKSSRELGADVCNLGARIKSKFLTEKSLKEYNWNEKYKNADFFVKVDYRTMR